MKPQRLTIYAATRLSQALVGFEHNRGGRINQIAEDYLSLISDHCPNFSELEWETLKTTLASKPLLKTTPLRLLWALLLESGDEYDPLAQKVRSLDTAALIAFRERLLQLSQTCESDSEKATDDGVLTREF